MSASTSTDVWHPPGGSPGELRETVAELMAVVEMRATIVARYAALGDDAGLAYGLRCMTAEFRAALKAAGTLAEITKPERDARRAATASRHEAREVRA